MPSLKCLCALCCSRLPKLVLIWVRGGFFFGFLFVFSFKKRTLVSNLAMKKVRIGDPVVSAVSF